MRLGVYAGSFDPVHNGHISVMDYLIDNNYLDKIVILPTKNYWNKRNLTDIDKRLEMLKMIKRNYLIIDGVNNKYDYTYQVLEALKKDYPNDDLYLIIGADNIVSFDKWMKVLDIISENKIIILNRGNIDIKKYVAKFDNQESFIIINDYPFVDISSTKLRNKLDKNYLPTEIYNFIIENRLYNN